MCGLALPFHTLCCELAVSRMKRGAVEEVMVSCVFWPLVWSVPLSTDCLCCHCHIPDPLYWTVHPLSNKEALRNVLTNALSPLFTHPRGVLPVWCWASNGQFNLCGTFSVSFPSRVCSSRKVVVHLACLVCMTVWRGVPSVGVMRKHWFQWSTHEHPVHWFFMR